MGPAQNTQKYLDDPGPPRDNKFKGQKLADLLIKIFYRFYSGVGAVVKMTSPPKNCKKPFRNSGDSGGC